MNSTDGRFTGIYKCGSRTLEFGKKTLIMGILNLTPDSFSDGGRYTDVDAAVDQCARMIREGADCIDIGAEATGPNAVPVTAEEEMERLIPSLEAIRSRFDTPLSVDTFKSVTAAAAITAGADICGRKFRGRNQIRAPEKIPETVRRHGRFGAILAQQRHHISSCLSFCVQAFYGICAACVAENGVVTTEINFCAYDIQVLSHWKRCNSAPRYRLLNYPCR